ncbi:uncharacterized protein LOC144347006, partial [Saccoglossus kowalevskii]
SGRPFAYVTWFREPISRLISTYYYLKANRCGGLDHVMCREYVINSKSLSQYFKNTEYMHHPDMNNLNVRLLQFGDFPDIDSTFEDCCGAAGLGDVFDIPAVEEKHYLVAKRNIQTKMAFVGITEDFKTSQDMLSSILGLPIQNEIHRNANSHSSNVTDYELKQLIMRNYWDIKLYEDAKFIYEQQKKYFTNIH